MLCPGRFILVESVALGLSIKSLPLNFDYKTAKKILFKLLRKIDKNPFNGFKGKFY